MTETPYNSVSDERLEKLCRWLQDNHITTQGLTSASSDAGFRRYFRVPHGSTTVIAVDAPPESEDSQSFIDIATRLADSRLRVPQIHCYNLENGFMVQEDFGHCPMQTVVDHNDTSSPVTHDLYTKAIDAVITMQAQTNTDGLPGYTGNFMHSELALFCEWYVSRHLQRAPDNEQQKCISNAFSAIVDVILQQPLTFVHRDFHCRNLMVLPSDNSLGIIDFQGALLGPATYDPVSLLRDVYLELPAGFQESFMQQHRQSMHPLPDWQTYQRWFDFTGLQRHLKILGIFCRLHYRDSKSDYLTHLPAVTRQIHNVLQRYPELTAFDKYFATIHQQ